MFYYHSYCFYICGNRMQVVQWLAKHVICTHKQSGSCTVEFPQSWDRPMTMLYYVHQTLFFPHPHTKERKGPGYARLPTNSTAKFSSFTQVNWQGSTHFCGPTFELENFYIIFVNLLFLFVLWKSPCSGIDYVFPT